MLILDFLYALILLCTFPFWAKYIFKKKYRRLLKDRLRPQMPTYRDKTIWIHAVSVGEVRSLKSLIRLLTEKQQQVVLSVTTPSGYEFACKEYLGLRVIHSPLDLSYSIKHFISCINPKLVIFNELEVWPNWISLLHRKKIPMLLINGRISEAAFSRYRFFNFFLWRFFRQIDCFLVQNNIYKQRFQQLKIPAEKIIVCGNIKADEADRSLHQLPNRKDVLAHLRLDSLPKKIITLASSHIGSENIVIPAIERLSANFFFIIVPRHVQRAKTIARQLERNGLKYAFFSNLKQINLVKKQDNLLSKLLILRSRVSQQQNMNSDIQVLIYDRMGYLFPIMSITDIVFMGGTHDQKIGGHNLYEPAAMGKLILGGPYYNNFPDIGRELEASGVYHQINSSHELVDFANRYQNLDLKQLNEKALKAVLKRKGSLACTLDQIQRFIS
jgi:3-deoxy-D-manno-octulosonic-acid transferase